MYPLLNGSGNTYVTGYFTGTATFGSTNLTSAGIVDIFVAKLGVSALTSIANESITPQIKIYPNPTNGILNIETGTNTALAIRLYSLNGKQLLQQTVSGSATLQVQHLPQGMYILQVTNGTQTTTHKVVVE